MKTAFSVLLGWLFAGTAMTHAVIVQLKEMSIDFTDLQDATNKATWSVPEKIAVSKAGLGWDGDALASYDGWIQTKPLALGLSWRPTSAISIRCAIRPPENEGAVYARYSPDLAHWSSWQLLGPAGPNSLEEKRTPSRYYGGMVRVPGRDRIEYDKLLREYWRLDVPWVSDEEAAVQWILGQQPDFFARQIPFIGYVEFLFEASFPGGQRIKAFHAEISYAMGGIHMKPKDESVYKQRDSQPWRFVAPEKLSPKSKASTNPPPP